jgi:hypothetical protein
MACRTAAGSSHQQRVAQLWCLEGRHIGLSLRDEERELVTFRLASGNARHSLQPPRVVEDALSVSEEPPGPAFQMGVPLFLQYGAEMGKPTGARSAADQETV